MRLRTAISWMVLPLGCFVLLCLAPAAALAQSRAGAIGLAQFSESLQQLSSRIQPSVACEEVLQWQEPLSL